MTMRAIGSRVAARATLGAALVTVVAASAGAQAPPTVEEPATQELGVDVGGTIGLGSNSSVLLTLPASRARIGFFLANGSRWSIEPAAFLSYAKVKGSSSTVIYDVQTAMVYHFRLPSDVYGEVTAPVGFFRPFVGVDGTSGGGTTTEVSVGTGVGLKVPWRADLVFRFEADIGYGFRNDAARLGAFAGLSFFTRRGSATRAAP
jgi:hypothetical protein